MSATLEGFFDAASKYLIHSVPASSTYKFAEDLESNRNYSASYNSVCDFIERRLAAHMECSIYLHWWTDSWIARYTAQLEVKDYVESMERREQSRDPNVTIPFHVLRNDSKLTSSGWFIAQIIIK